ncbi:Os01g0760701 [Oryza sativa Japonica Group]|uniref:Os01g0760701 protein n=1 Tax=Oryza sativa subsp. japonica TaxID=39947 RepID=A0A0N7KDS7_ORYSJ|nr:Os01g0760701 [Oryza sativa Japonica Group]
MVLRCYSWRELLCYHHSLQFCDCGMDCICKMRNGPPAQTSHTDPPIRCHVNVVFLPHESHLITVEPSESEHSDLLNDVTPKLLPLVFRASKSCCLMLIILSAMPFSSTVHSLNIYLSLSMVATIDAP